MTEAAIERVASLRPFRLPGGDAAIKEPRRTALGILYEVCGARVTDCNGLASVAAFSAGELSGLRTMLERGVERALVQQCGTTVRCRCLFNRLRQSCGLRPAAMDLSLRLPASRRMKLITFRWWRARGRLFWIGPAD